MVNKANTTPSARKLMDKALGIAQGAALPPYDAATVPGDRADLRRVAGQSRRPHARQGRDLRDLLRQLQRARHRPRPPAGPRAQRDPYRLVETGSLLRDAEARARRPRVRRDAQGRQHRPAGRAGARGLRHPDRRSLRARSCGSTSCRSSFRTIRTCEAVADAMFDPFEYLVLRDKDGLLRKDFTTPLGKVSYHIPCHSRVQNVGQKTREVLEWIPGTDRQHGGALRRARRHVRREARVLREFDEDRQARFSGGWPRPSPISSVPTARSRDAGSRRE